MSLQQGQKSNQGHTMMLHTYSPYPMVLPSIKFPPLTVSEKWPGQEFQNQCQFGKFKGQIKVTPWHCTPTPPNQWFYQVSNSYHLQFPRNGPDKNFKINVNLVSLKVKSRSHHGMAHLHPLPNVSTNVSTKYRLSYTLRFLGPWTNFS